MNESGKIDYGYKFVWKFSTSQANGTISAVALTHKYGGLGYSEIVIRKVRKCFTQIGLNFSMLEEGDELLEEMTIMAGILYYH